MKIKKKKRKKSTWMLAQRTWLPAAGAAGAGAAAQGGACGCHGPSRHLGPWPCCAVRPTVRRGAPELLKRPAVPAIRRVESDRRLRCRRSRRRRKAPADPPNPPPMGGNHNSNTIHNQPTHHNRLNSILKHETGYICVRGLLREREV